MSRNPNQAFQTLLKKNPNLQQYWQQAQMLASQNKTDAVEYICKQKGLSKEQVINEARQYGINI